MLKSEVTSTEHDQASHLEVGRSKRYCRGATLYLSKHVHFCEYYGDYIFLDLQRDAYEMIPKSQAMRFNDVIDHGFEEFGLLEQEFGTEIIDTLRFMYEHDMITVCPDKGKAFQPYTVPSSDKDLELLQSRPAKLLGLSSVGVFYGVVTRAYIELKLRKLRTVIERVQERKNQDPNATTVNQLDHFITRTKQFMWLRDFFPSTGMCLFNSYALIEYLAFYKLYPTWTFGVRSRDWEAHCWVETEGTILNDSLDRVKRFRPIMQI